MYQGVLGVAAVLILLGVSPREKNRSGKGPLQVAHKDCRFFRTVCRDDHPMERTA